MKAVVFFYLPLLLAVALTGCDRLATSSPKDVQATPTPAPADVTADRMREKTSEAAQATGDYLKEQGKQLKANFKETSEELAKDREVWKRQIEEKTRQYQPQIDELKRKAAGADAQAKVEYEKQTANLEVQRKKADEKLVQLRSATADAWETFKESWKREQATETPTPAP